MFGHIPIVAVIAGTLLCPRLASAQAWVPAQGEGSVALLVQDLFVKDHLSPRGERRDRGHIDSSSLAFDVTYGVTDRLAVTFAVPYIRARYTGTQPHPNAQDDGSVHGGFQDLRFNVRYNVARGPMMITPFVGTNVPSHAYEYFAHAAYGTRVREVEVGTYVGSVLNTVLPNAFVQARYAYSLRERIVGISHNRSKLDLEFGYFVTPKIRVFTLGTGHKTHGGIDVPDAGWRAMSPEQGPHHDRIGRIDLLDAGGGVQVSLTDSVDVFGSYMKSLAGRNTHALDRAITIGASWSFGQSLRGLLALESRAAAPSSRSAPAGDAARKRLVKCLCQK